MQFRALLFSIMITLPVSARPAVFFSIDGLDAAFLRTAKAEGQLQAPRGLGWLLDSSTKSFNAQPVLTPITAPSHISTITCTPPSRHGIHANNFFRNGKKVSGFAADFNTEPFWLTLSRQGKSVLSIGYPGADGVTGARSATWGLAYPLHGTVDAAKSISLASAALTAAKDWQLPSDLSSGQWQETATQVTLNPQSGETRTINILVGTRVTGQTEIYASWDKDLTRGELRSLDPKHPGRTYADLITREKSSDSTISGRKRRVILRAYTSKTGEHRLYVSGASYNQAYPESLARKLDDLNLIWPDYGFSEGGIELKEWVESYKLIDRFIAEVAVALEKDLKPDVMLLYQPLIDGLGHHRRASLPEPFSTKKSDTVSQAYLQAFKAIDENISLVVSAVKSDITMLVGDHGMDRVDTAVNGAKLLEANEQDAVIIYGSGDLLFVYGKQSTELSKVDDIASKLQRKLAELRYEGKPVLGFFKKRSDYKIPGKHPYQDEWQYGDAVAVFAGAKGIWLTYQPSSSEIFKKPDAEGMHGKGVAGVDMQTMFIAKGQMFPEKIVKNFNLIDAIPTFAKALGIEPPKDCLGKPII